MPGNADQLLLDAKMYAIGDKFDTASLKAMALKRFNRGCLAHWNTDEFAAAAHHVFTSTPDTDMGLRDIVAETISDHMDIFQKPAVEALTEKFHSLAIAVLRLRAREATWKY